MQKNEMAWTDERLAARDLIRNVLTDFIKVTDRWIGPGDRMADPYELDYSENYAPATAAVAYVQVYRFSNDEHALNQCIRLLRRSIVLLGDKVNNQPFQRVFLLHYSLQAILLLPRQVRDSLREEFQPALAAYEDDCKHYVTNCSALQWATEVMLEALGYRPANREVLRRSMARIVKSRTASGFLNDEVDWELVVRDGMPVGYHYFMVFILMSAAVFIDRSRVEEDLRVQLELADEIIAAGLQWTVGANAGDGTYAMTERSRYQIFPWGVLTALSVYAGWEDGLLLQTVKSWLPYRKDDGTYSCTPNYLPHGLRAGFEGYTHVNMYNTMAITGIAVAERLLEGGSELNLPTDRVTLPVGDTIIDPTTGLVFARNGNQFFACTMRMFHRGYTAAMQGLHFRLDGKPVPFAEPSCRNWTADIQPIDQESLWEGYLLHGEDGRWHIPNFRDNAAAVVIPNGVRLMAELPEYRVDKRIEATDRSLRWSYSIECRSAFASCRHVLPLLIFDGKHETTLREISLNVIEISFNGDRYELRCEQASRIELSLNRSLLSGSGVASLISLDIAAATETGNVVEWTTELRLI